MTTLKEKRDLVLNFSLYRRIKRKHAYAVLSLLISNALTYLDEEAFDDKVQKLIPRVTEALSNPKSLDRLARGDLDNDIDDTLGHRDYVIQGDAQRHFLQALHFAFRFKKPSLKEVFDALLKAILAQEGVAPKKMKKRRQAISDGLVAALYPKVQALQRKGRLNEDYSSEEGFTEEEKALIRTLRPQVPEA